MTSSEELPELDRIPGSLLGDYSPDPDFDRLVAADLAESNRLVAEDIELCKKHAAERVARERANAKLEQPLLEYMAYYDEKHAAELAAQRRVIVALEKQLLACVAYYDAQARRSPR